MDAENVLTAFLIGSIAILLFFVLLTIINYFLQAIGLFNIAKKKGIEHHWLAWIPILNVFVMTMLVENVVHKSLRGKFTLIYGIVLGCSIILSMLGLTFIAIIPMIMMYYAFFLIAKERSSKPVVHLVISIITFGLAMPLQLFMLRNREVMAIVE